MGQAKDWRVAARDARKAEALKVFRRTGNASEVWRVCGLGNGTTGNWRKADAAFAAEWDAALAAYETQRIKALVKPASKPTRFNATLQRDVLDMVAGARSVAAAARATGIDPTTVWALARRDLEFATALTRAVDQAYKQNEVQLISDCVHGIEPLADETRERVSDVVRARMVSAGHNKAAAREAAASDEADRDRNEAIAARWVAKFLAELAAAS